LERITSQREPLPEANYIATVHHGLPERHMRKADPTGNHCLASPDCCETPSVAHKTCYRAQCFASARLLRERLASLPKDAAAPVG
jgi:ferrochelatase